MRHEKMMKQVEEGALLVENHKLEVLLDDDATTRRNRNRQYLSKVITIQRAWRAYLARVSEAQELVRRAKEASSVLVEEELSETESAHGGGDMTLSTPEENTEDSVAGRGQGARSRSGSRLREPSSERVLDTRKSPLRQLRDAECESVVSDYSEVSAPLRDIESELQFVKSDELHRENFSIFPCLNPLPSDAIEREPGESDQAFSKRVRKINYLSLAQEFAELKKVNAAALPFDLHKNQGQDGSVKESSPSSEASSSFDEAEYYLTESAITSPMDSDKEFGEGGSDLENDGGSIRDDGSGPKDRASKQEKTDSAPPQDGALKGRASESGARQAGREGEGLAPKDRDSVKGGHGRDHPVSNNVNRKTRSREGSKQGRDHRSSSRPRTGAVSSRSRDGSRGERRRRSSGGGRAREGSRETRGCRSREASSGTPSGGPRSRDASKDSARDQDSEAGDFEVYNMAATVPSMDWDTLEQQLALAAAAEEQREQSRQSEREQIRQKLAMGVDEDYYYGERAFRKPSLQTRLQSGMNLQICFMNEVACDDDLASSPQDTGHVSRSPPMSSPPRTLPSTSTTSSGRHQAAEVEDDQDFFKKQARLQEEATLALAQAGTMARMQLQVEKQMKKKSPIADMLGLPTLEDGRRQKLTRKLLSEMNLAQIQVLVNDFHTQIENLNEELVHLLLERDDLHMEQDSMLVDIEDHSRRAQEYLEKVHGKEAVQKQREAISKK